MVITSDFNIFADRYHGKPHIPNDLINMIMNINTDQIKNEKEIYNNKENYNKVMNVINDHRIFLNTLEDFDENECIDWMLGVRSVNALDDYIDY